MDDQKLSDAALDNEIARALAVDPSAAFVAGIRQRVAAEGLPRVRIQSWVIGLTLAGAMAALAVVFVGPAQIARRPGVVPPLPSRAMRLDEVALSGGNTNLSTVRVRVTTSAQAAHERHIGHEALQAEILVDLREARAIRTFVNGAVKGGLDLAALEPAPTLPPGPAAVQAISIAPINLSPLAGDEKGGPQ